MRTSPQDRCLLKLPPKHEPLANCTLHLSPANVKQTESRIRRLIQRLKKSIIFEEEICRHTSIETDRQHASSVFMPGGSLERHCNCSKLARQEKDQAHLAWVPRGSPRSRPCVTVWLCEPIDSARTYAVRPRARDGRRTMRRSTDRGIVRLNQPATIRSLVKPVGPRGPGRRAPSTTTHASRSRPGVPPPPREPTHCPFHLSSQRRTPPSSVLLPGLGSSSAVSGSFGCPTVGYVRLWVVMGMNSSAPSLPSGAPVLLVPHGERERENLLCFSQGARTGRNRSVHAKCELLPRVQVTLYFYPQVTVYFTGAKPIRRSVRVNSPLLKSSCTLHHGRCTKRSLSTRSLLEFHEREKKLVDMLRFLPWLSGTVRVPWSRGRKFYDTPCLLGSKQYEARRLLGL